MFLWCSQVRLLFFGNLRAKAMPQYRNLPTSWRRFSPIKMEAERLSHKRHLLLKIFPSVIRTIRNHCRSLWYRYSQNVRLSRRYSCSSNPRKEHSHHSKVFTLFGTGFCAPKKASLCIGYKRDTARLFINTSRRAHLLNVTRIFLCALS